MRPLLVLLVLLGAAIGLAPTPADAIRRARVERSSVPTVIANVHVFDANTGLRSGPSDVWLQDGTIAAVTPPGERATTQADRLVDGHGQTLLPGLIDCHTHLVGDGDPGLYAGPLDVTNNLTGLLAAGVTSVLSTGDPLDRISALADAVSEGRRPGPAIFYVGLPVTVVGGHPVASAQLILPKALHKTVSRALADEVADGGEAAIAVAERVLAGASAVKVVVDDLPTTTPQMTPELLAAIVRTSHGMRIRVVAHVGEPEDVTAGLDAGVDGFIHHPNRGALSEAQIARLAEARVPVVATLKVFRRLRELANDAVVITPLEEALAHPRPLRRLRTGGWLRGPDLPAPIALWMQQNTESHDAMLASVGALHAGGGLVLAGSDTANIGAFVGAGLHDELDLLVEAGLTPAEALQAATLHAARFVAPGRKFGLIEAGWEADLLLVDGDPTASLGPVHRPVAVWVDGRFVQATPRLQ